MGIGGSRHKNQGWQGQLARVRRWYRRVQKIGMQMSQAVDTEDEHDFVYAFFQNCFYFRDWLKNAGAVSTAELDAFFQRHKEMQVSRDICNGTKHYRVDHPSVDAHFSIGREYVPADWPGARPHINESWFIIAGDTKYDLFELADKCMTLWHDFLRQHGLLEAREVV